MKHSESLVMMHSERFVQIVDFYDEHNLHQSVDCCHFSLSWIFHLRAHYDVHSMKLYS